MAWPLKDGRYAEPKGLYFACPGGAANGHTRSSYSSNSGFSAESLWQNERTGEMLTPADKLRYGEQLSNLLGDSGTRKTAHYYSRETVKVETRHRHNAPHGYQYGPL